MRYLVIVESPTKAKTISRFLDKSYQVESSFGHVRDLPKSELGVDVEGGFTPRYVIPRSAQKRVHFLKKAAKSADVVYLATDEDREGEAISWHLRALLDVPDSAVKRIAFHEITERAIHEALKNPRSIDAHLVDAQQARRIVDRLVGYQLSPLLWRKIARGLSAGRVQSVAVRLIVDREREIRAFVPQEYWTIEAELANDKGAQFTARLYKRNQKVVEKFAFSTEAAAEQVRADISMQSFVVHDVIKKETRRAPSSPFTTSLLQQEANRRLRYSAKQTMMIAQQLYEGIESDPAGGGYITYMRTDSSILSQDFLSAAQSFISSSYGSEYTKGPRAYATKSRLAQEAHEAIRPTDIARTPESVKQYLTDQQFALYDLIWRRAVASQMTDAVYQATVIDTSTHGESRDEYLFRSSGQTLVFDGFTHVYPIDSIETLLPACEKGEMLRCREITKSGHTTKPPARYSEAGLVKALEEYGIGRPSTYAPTISTVIERGYVEREERRLKPTELAFLVTDLLVEHFPQIVDYSFTAHMEDDLDKIASGGKEWVPIVSAFHEPFSQTLAQKDKELTKASFTAETTDEVCPTCGKPLVIRIGRYGKFFACTGFPECKYVREYRDPNAPQEEEQIEPCEKCGSPMIKKRGRFGFFFGCSTYPDCKNIRSLTQKKLGIPCPTCGSGEVISRKTKGNKFFYGCSRYPECEYRSWKKPTAEGDEASEGS